MKVTELEAYLYERGYYTANAASLTKIYKTTGQNERILIGHIWHKQTRTNFEPMETIDVEEVVVKAEYKALGTLILLLGIAVVIKDKGVS